VGARIPDHAVVQALLATLEEPLLSSTLILPGEYEAMTEGWAVQEALDGLVDAVVESGVVASEPTTVIDFVDGVPEIVRVGAGDTSRFV
jgi:tRNA A37 threonylcarbamoyladenosine synthetase subunit TsaC/SUA5/YrdC